MCIRDRSRTGQKLEVSDTGSTGSLSLRRYSANAHPSYVDFFKSRSGTLGGETVVQSGDNLGQITWGGSDGTDMVSVGARILAEVDGTQGSIDLPGRLEFHTTADGSATSTERIRIGSAGQIGLGGATYGSSGQVLTSQGSGSAVQWATASAGIEMAQHFRLTSSSQGNQSPLTNWEAADNSFAGSLGSSMSVSSGVFTYPSTGIYFCLFTLVGYSDSSTQNLIGSIQQSTDGGSNWGNAAYGLNGIYDFSNSYPSWGNTATHYIFDITDTSQQKTRFIYGAGQGLSLIHI